MYDIQGNNTKSMPVYLKPGFFNGKEMRLKNAH